MTAQRPIPAKTKDTPLPPQLEAARSVVLRLRSAMAQLGGLDELVYVLGGNTGLEDLFGTRASENGTTPRLSENTLREYCRRNVASKTNAALQRSNHLPGEVNTKRLTVIAELVEPFLPPEHLGCTDTQLEDIRASIQFIVTNQLALARVAPNPTATGVSRT